MTHTGEGSGTGIAAMAHWRRLDGAGTDRCTLARADHGWLLTGRAVWLEDEMETALTYAVRCDPDWRSLSADVTGTRGGAEIGLRIAQAGDAWLLNDVPQPDLGGCIDLDLSFTPATNLLPLRRLPLDAGDPCPVGAAWLVPGLDRLERLDQTYARAYDGAVNYASPGFSARLTVHPSGFVTVYPGLWDGWVDT